MNITAKKTLDATESNKQLKKALKAAFPGVKFSCRMSRGTGYGNVTVSWTDGPTVAQVEEVTRCFEGEGFDGMTDSSYKRPTAIDVGGELFESGLGLINTHRDFSDELVAKAISELQAEGYSEKFAGSLDSVARAILRGCAKHVAVDSYHLVR